jgi:arylsulfatase A
MASPRHLNRLLLALATLWLSGATNLSAAEPKPAKPNFVVINIDDLGYADIGPFGSKINRTPHLDTMAKEGRKLTSFYAAPVCSPSRAALMTGCYPKRVLPIGGVLFPGEAVGLSPSEVTVAEVLKAEGYATAIVGKWHLGDQPEFLPNKQGFDLHFGLPYSNDMGPAEDGVKSDLGKPLPKTKGGGQPPLPLLRNGTVVKRVMPDDQQSLVEIYTTEAVNFITTNKDRPFFLYLPHNAVHFPVYPGKNWAGKSPHGIFSDWVEEVDWSVGQVLDALRKQGLAERTLVIFTSDNGGTPRSVNAPLRGHKGSTLEGGMREPTIAWWPGKIPAGTETDAILGMFDILPTFAALAGGKVPADRKIDGADIWPQLAGVKDAKPAHETFYYYRGLKLEAVRHGDWKLHLASTAKKDADTPAAKIHLYNLKTDIGEAKDVAADHPDIVKKLEGLVALMKDDLGLDGIGPGCRELGRVKEPKPLIAKDGTVRPGFEPPIRIESDVSGHIHPALCISKKGTLVAVFCKREYAPYLITRSTDGGKTWSKPEPFPHTIKTQVYPGSLTTLADGRLVHAWNVWFSPEEKVKSRYVAYSVSSDDGVTWSEPKSLSKNPDPKTESVIRHPIVELSPTAWLFPLMDRTIVYNPETGVESPFGDERKHGLVPIVRTAKGTLVSGKGLRSTDGGKTWQEIKPFPDVSSQGWRQQLIALKNGWLLASQSIGPGVGGDKIHFVLSRDDGQTWDLERPVVFYDPGRPIGGRACPRSVEIDDQTLGTIFYDIDAKQPGGSGVFFRRLPLARLAD